MHDVQVTFLFWYDTLDVLGSHIVFNMIYLNQYEKLFCGVPMPIDTDLVTKKQKDEVAKARYDAASGVTQEEATRIRKLREAALPRVAKKGREFAAQHDPHWNKEVTSSASPQPPSGRAAVQSDDMQQKVEPNDRSLNIIRRAFERLLSRRLDPKMQRKGSQKEQWKKMIDNIKKRVREAKSPQDVLEILLKGAEVTDKYGKDDKVVGVFKEMAALIEKDPKNVGSRCGRVPWRGGAFTS